MLIAIPTGKQSQHSRDVAWKDLLGGEADDAARQAATRVARGLGGFALGANLGGVAEAYREGHATRSLVRIFRRLEYHSAPLKKRKK